MALDIPLCRINKGQKSDDKKNSNKGFQKITGKHLRLSVFYFC